MGKRSGQFSAGLPDFGALAVAATMVPGVGLITTMGLGGALLAAACPPTRRIGWWSKVDSVKQGNGLRDRG